MKKRIMPLVVALGISTTLLPYAVANGASNSAKIDQEIANMKKMKSAAEQKAKDVQNQLTQVQQEKQETAKDIETLMNQVDSATAKLSGLNVQIENTTEDLEDNAKQLDEAEKRVETRDELLKKRMRIMYENGSVSYLEVVLNSTSFSDFIDRMSALKSIVGQDKEILEANKKDRALVAEKKQQIEKQLAYVKNLYAQTETLKQDLLVKEKAKEVKIASLSAEQQHLEEISSDQEQAIMEYAKKESQLQAKKAADAKAAAAAAAAAASKNSSSFGGSSGSSGGGPATGSGGSMGYPLPKRVSLSSGFGGRVDPINGSFAGHTGIDMPSPQGTDIYAAESGTVLVASEWSGYGNCVIIDHGGGVWTLYGHIRNGGIKVSKGQSVKRGEKIAEVGSTGRSTGNHLHFEVRINSKPVNPSSYIGY
ncbi:murein hydrolase activator EnvC family protein [Paenibacillus chitinolyticus]|uniref:murein hydrolase activator EnvC family protein n=1 Tax=Paenibacillus chitinolyticus TaxID=79263 RepID=UPI0026E4DDF4|nr:M23 family metallopeptidase [Paenibacillus chitinolyticus]GKS14135.1 peptidase [Paenibacillus chitinolyticus]